MNNNDNNNNIDLSNNKIVNNITDTSLNKIIIDMSNNIYNTKTNITRHYSINLNDFNENNKNSILDLSSNKKNSIIENSKHIIPYNNKDNLLENIDMRIKQIIHKIRQERNKFRNNIGDYERNRYDSSKNTISNSVNNIYNDFTYSSTRNYRGFINNLDRNKKSYINKGVSTDDKPIGNTSKYTSDSHHKRINEIRRFMRNTDDTFYNKYNKPNFHGVQGPLNPLRNIPSESLKDSLFHRERNILEKSLHTTPEKKKVNIEVEIETIDDILKIIEDYPIQYDIEYNINVQALHNIKEPLEKLNRMIGMKSLKTNILDQILYFVQDLHKNEEVVEKKLFDGLGRIIGTTKVKQNKGGDFMHTCIYGPPGTGKTEVAKIMGSIFSKLGVLRKNVFKKVTRADLIAGYLGQTAMKTRDAVKDCLGGVMFIDEAYALGNVEKRDSFAKECIDTLCEALSDHKDELMVIIAGYEKELNKCFFSYNQGLDSRFTWRFKTDDYSADELRQIFIKKVKEMGWKIEEGNVNTEWFEKNKDFFKFYGRDMENLFSKVKIAHSRRVFCLPADKKKNINDKDLERGLNMFLSNEDVKKRKDDKEKYEQLYYKMYT